VAAPGRSVTVFVSPCLSSSQNAKALKYKKEEGNKAFKEGRYEAAYELYSAALTIDPNNIKTNAKLFCNRGTVGSKVSTGHRRTGRHIRELETCLLMSHTHTVLFTPSSVDQEMLTSIVFLGVVLLLMVDRSCY